MIGAPQEETGVSLPGNPDGLIFFLCKMGDLFLQVRCLKWRVIAGEKLVGQAGECSDRSRRSGVQPLICLSSRVNGKYLSWMTPGAYRDPINLDSIDQLAESLYVRSGALPLLPTEYHRAAQHGDDKGARLKVISWNLRVLDGRSHVRGSGDLVVSHCMLIENNVPAIVRVHPYCSPG
ncbi:unnamed protein product [Linum trigynum]|uniref:Uncharacterized protein n=1 Tax=Linum trigynum TaxID=586398 RepID=A0AAV2EV20_9ROSI